MALALQANLGCTYTRMYSVLQKVTPVRIFSVFSIKITFGKLLLNWRILFHFILDGWFAVISL